MPFLKKGRVSTNTQVIRAVEKSHLEAVKLAKEWKGVPAHSEPVASERLVNADCVPCRFSLSTGPFFLWTMKVKENVMHRCGTEVGFEIRKKIPSSCFLMRGAEEALQGT